MLSRNSGSAEQNFLLLQAITREAENQAAKEGTVVIWLALLHCCLMGSAPVCLWKLAGW